ncbi:phage resistance protein [Egbenema bharatensis]|uniref:phage resistance protein n=1 Tax=Egbenema bharatensis TaxID=3463334 RepID=UPI003A88CCAA
MTLIKDLIDIPERVQKGDFVLKLTEGVTRPEVTLKDYVVTPELKDCFDNALTFIRSALQGNSSKASYLHGSFGSGKSHFMAVLNLILQGISEARAIPELAPVIAKHNQWITGKTFLLVPYHMIGATDMESGILGGYVDYIRRTHPDAPIPGVYLAEGLFQDAQALRDRIGDEQFFGALSEGSSTDSGWGELAAGWDAERFENALIAPPGDEERSQLISVLVKQFFKSYDTQSEGRGEAFLSLDKGLAVISKHAQTLGYDALILFLDELILWLASRATDLKFVHQEGQKLAKLVEAQTADRPIPVISFVARQRDLSELIGDSIPGAERLNFSDALKHWEGRFHRITLEDRNLPAIAERRVLKCKTNAARKELDAAFEQTARVREAVMNTLLTSEGDREMFRKVYPFSPALVQTLIAVSSVLQRERTALKVMMQLLVDQQEMLAVGSVVPVGDLFDVIAHGDEAFSQEMAIHFENAKRLYHQKLLPMLEKQHGRREDLEKRPFNDPNWTAFRNDDRLVKTLLLSALVPQVESLRAITPEKLAALNHGTIKSPIPNREGQEVLRRCRDWAASVGELRITSEDNPTLSIQLSGVDTDSILQQAQVEDNRGNRIRLVRDMLFTQLGIKGEDEFEQYYNFDWRNTKRSCIVLFRNIRDLSETAFENHDDRWKLIIDFPFDDPGFYPSDDRSKCDGFKAAHPEGTKTVCWIPAFFSADALKDLGTLVILEHILASDDRFSQYSTQLSPQDRQTAKSLLDNQRSVLRQRVQNHLDAAYGLQIISEGSLDTTSSLEPHEQFVSLANGLDLRPPVAADLKGAMTNLLDQVLTHEFPAAPSFDADVNRVNHLEKVYQVVSAAAQAQDGRTLVDRPLRLLIRQIANPLKLGEMGLDATHFVIGQHWKNHFNRKAAEAGGTIRVDQMRQWIDQPQAMGLPKEVQNLVILTYADQTGKTFSRLGLPVEPTLRDVPNDCELKEQQLPDEEHWQIAIERAKDIFKLSISPLCKASNLADLEAKVKARASDAINPCQRYTQALQNVLTKFELSLECDRMNTASATLALLEQVGSGKPEDMVDILCTAEVATTETAMGECLNHAGGLAGKLENANWELFEAIAQLTDDRQPTAKQIQTHFSQAITSDEHVTALGPVLQETQSQAVRLLAKPVEPAPVSSKTPSPEPSTPPIPAPPPIPPQKRRQTVEQNTQEDLKLKDAQTLLDSLEQKLQDGQEIRLSISWIIEGDIEGDVD